VDFLRDSRLEATEDRIDLGPHFFRSDSGRVNTVIETNDQPRGDSIRSAASGDMLLDRLSTNLISPGRMVGNKTCWTWARSAAASVEPSRAVSAVEPAVRAAPMIVVVSQRPCGAGSTRRISNTYDYLGRRVRKVVEAWSAAKPGLAGACDCLTRQTRRLQIHHRDNRHLCGRQPPPNFRKIPHTELDLPDTLGGGLTPGRANSSGGGSSGVGSGSPSNAISTPNRAQRRSNHGCDLTIVINCLNTSALARFVRACVA